MVRPTVMAFLLVIALVKCEPIPGSTVYTMCQSVHGNEIISTENLKRVCPTGWKSNKNRWYCVFNDQKTWPEAQAKCKETFSNLVKIDNQAEMDWILANVDKKVGSYWIGLNDLMETDNYTWISDFSAPLYTNWAKDEPNGSDEHCVHFYNDPNNAKYGQWNDLPCKKAEAFICKV